MGTSKSYGSPKWLDVNPQVSNAVSDGEKVSSAVGAFAGAYKSYINSGTTGRTGAPSGGTSATGRTVGAKGGGGGATARDRAAATSVRLGRFLSGAASSGLGPTLEKFGIKYLEGKPLGELLDAILDKLCEDGGLLDDAAFTEAMAQTLDEVSEGTETVEEFDDLLSGRAENIEEHLQIYFANVLAVNFQQKESGIVREKIPQEQCDKFFKQARELIRSLVKEELSQERDLASIDWSSAEAILIANEINQEVLNILIDDE